jgi:hypothetical protein
MIAFKSALAASPIDPVPGPLYSRWLSSFVPFSASMNKSFHCPASRVEFAIFEANKKPSARSKLGWLRIVAYTKPPMRGSLSTSACAPARRDSHIGSEDDDDDDDRPMVGPVRTTTTEEITNWTTFFRFCFG